jgi:hypothetical protein
VLGSAVVEENGAGWLYFVRASLCGAGDRRLGDSRRVGYSYHGSDQLSGRQATPTTGLVLGWCWAGAGLGWHWLRDGLISGPLGVLMDGRARCERSLLVCLVPCPASPHGLPRVEGGGRGNGVLGVGLRRSLYHSCHCRTWPGFDASLGRSHSTKLVPVTGTL